MRQLEFFLIFCTLGVLGGVALSVLEVNWRHHVNQRRRLCYLNLRRVGMAMQIWAGDHEGKFPFEVSTNSGGTREYFQPQDTYRHFNVLSNELGNPRVLVCNVDLERASAPDYASISNRNLSYFVNLASSAHGPSNVLAGDRNIGLHFSGTNQQVLWGPSIHYRTGNILLNDGSAYFYNPLRSKINLEYYFRDAKLSIPR